MRKLTFLFFLLSVLGNAFAGEVKVLRINPFTNEKSSIPYIYYSGEIEKGDYEKLVRLAEADLSIFLVAPLVISSRGGSVSEAIKISNLIKETFKRVILTTNHGPCLSSCFFIIASAATRYIEDSRIGIHRPYLDKDFSKSISVSDYEKMQSKLIIDTARYLRDLGISEHLIEKMTRNSSTEIYWLTDEDKESIGLRSPWYEEYMTSVCGLNKNIEKLFFATNDQKIYRKHILPFQKCEVDKTIFEARNNMINIINRR